MRNLILHVGLIALVCSSCVRGYRDTTPYQLSGRQKAIVAVLPVIDNTSSSELAWSLSREFTEEIRKRVYDSKRMYLLREGGNRELAQLLSTPNPLHLVHADTAGLGAAEFALITEIIQQEETPYGVGSAGGNHLARSEVGALLSLALRVRVIDMRHEAPKVILQEVLGQDYVVARAYLNCDYAKTPWGTEAFERSPMGMAHTRAIKELVARVEAYIEAAR